MTAAQQSGDDTKNEVVEAIHKADLEIGKSLASRRDHPVIQWCCGVGEVGDQGPLYLIGASLLVTGALRRKPRCLLAGAHLLIAVGISDFSKSIIKSQVTRSRPQQALDEGDSAFELGGSDEKKEQSFPSGHVAGTVAAAGAISRIYTEATPYATSAAAIISLSRAVKGHHWPLDLAAGLAVGLASHAATCKIVDLILTSWIPSRKRRRLLKQ